MKNFHRHKHREGDGNEREGRRKEGYEAMYLHVYNCVSAAAAVVVFTCFVYKFAYAFFIFSPFFGIWFCFFFGDKKRFALVYAEKKREAEEENANKAFFVYLSFSLSWQHVVVALVLLAVVVAALVAKQCKKCLDKLKIKSNCKINEDSVCSCVCVCEEELQGAWVLEESGGGG